MTKKEKAYTFIELLIILSILIVFFAMSVPSVNQFIWKENNETVKLKLLTLIQFSQAEAFARLTPVILCHSQSRQDCDGNWSDKIIVMDAKTFELLQSDRLHIKSNTLHFRAFPILRHEYLLFSPDGLRNAENASFWYCNQKAEALWGIIINRVGRVRVIYPDEHGILSNNGQVFQCE